MPQSTEITNWFAREKEFHGLANLPSRHLLLVKLRISKPWATHLCLIVGGGGGGSNCKLLGENSKVHLIIIRDWPKNNPLPPF